MVTPSLNITFLMSKQFIVFESLVILPLSRMRKKFAYVESNKISMLVDHEKNALGAGYIVEFINDATENYY